MIFSRSVQYFRRQELLEELNFLRNERKKCGFCGKILREFCEAVKVLETEVWRKAYFSIQFDVEKWRLIFRGKNECFNLKAIW